MRRFEQQKQLNKNDPPSENTPVNKKIPVAFFGITPFTSTFSKLQCALLLTKIDILSNALLIQRLYHTPFASF